MAHYFFAHTVPVYQKNIDDFCWNQTDDIPRIALIKFIVWGDDFKTKTKSFCLRLTDDIIAPLHKWADIITWLKGFPDLIWLNLDFDFIGSRKFILSDLLHRAQNAPYVSQFLETDHEKAWSDLQWMGNIPIQYF